MAAPWTLVFDGGISLLTAGVFAYVGSLMHRRPVADADGRLAMRLFAAWWYALAVLTALGATTALLASAGALTLAFHTTSTYLSLLPLTVALWGLLYYLVFIFTGKSAWLTPLTAGYLVFYFVLNYVVYYLDPVGTDIGAWGVSLEYGRELTPPLASALAAVLLGPVLIAAIAYGSLFFTARQRSVRYRVALVSLAFIVWFGAAAIASATGLNEEEWWPIASRFISLGATLMILAAYRPPRSLAKRLGVEPVMGAASDPEERRLRGSAVTILVQTPAKRAPESRVA